MLAFFYYWREIEQTQNLLLLQTFSTSFNVITTSFFVCPLPFFSKFVCFFRFRRGKNSFEWAKFYTASNKKCKLLNRPLCLLCLCAWCLKQMRIHGRVNVIVDYFLVKIWIHLTPKSGKFLNFISNLQIYASFFICLSEKIINSFRLYFFTQFGSF